MIELGTEGVSWKFSVGARIQRIHMDSQYLDENNSLDNTKLDLVGRMGANWYTRANNEAPL